MELIAQNANRKVDNLGRVVLPKGLRDQYGVNEGDEISTFVLKDDGDDYICFKVQSKKEKEPKYNVAYQVLKELGCDIPSKLVDML